MGQQMALSCGLLAAQKLHKTCTNCTELPRAAPLPLHLYPESPPKLHPNVQPIPSCHGLKAKNISPPKPKGDGTANCPHHLKVANPSATVAESSPARCVSEREKGGDFALGDSKGRSPWRAFGDFRRETKVTRGLGRSAQIRGRRGHRPAPTPLGTWGGAPKSGAAGATSPAQTPPGGGAPKTQNNWLT